MMNDMQALVKNILICCVICSIALFVSSHRFVNAEVTPKWLYLMMAIGVIVMIFSARSRKNTLPDESSDKGLVKYLYGAVVIFALALCVHGILQYTGLLRTANSNFAITGSFDNPAGFAAALICALPLCFIFLADKKPYLRYTAIAAAVLIAVAILMSGSRAGMLAIVVSTVVWFIAQPDIINRKLKITLPVVLILLPVALYFFKKDSADGRLLIWRCTLGMVADKPLIGHGTGAFQAKYMLYQAAYLDAHPYNQYAQLAGNTLHPFNEYLLVLAEYGIAGLGVVALIIFLLVRACMRNRSEEKLAALTSLVALAAFSLFSYPFRYPFTWAMLLLNMAVIFKNSMIQKFKDSKIVGRRFSIFNFQFSIFNCALFLLSACLLTYTAMLTRAEITWNRIARQSLAGQTVKVLPEYDKLYPWLGKNGLFLYNHAAELHEAKEYERSVEVFELCARYFNDMDVQMFLADNYKELGKYTEAEQCLKLASAMCPARFMPPYELVKLYDRADRKDEALALAKKIMEKDVKIPSHTVTAIKNEMRQLIEATEMPDETENNNRTSDEPENDETRQGETPQGAALPP